MEKFRVIEIRKGQIYTYNSIGARSGPWRLAGRRLADDSGIQRPVAVDEAIVERINRAFGAGRAEPVQIPFVIEEDEIENDMMVLDEDRAALLDRTDRAEQVLRWLVSLGDPDGQGFKDREAVTLGQIIGRAREALGVVEEQAPRLSLP